MAEPTISSNYSQSASSWGRLEDGVIPSIWSTKIIDCHMVRSGLSALTAGLTETDRPRKRDRRIGRQIDMRARALTDTHTHTHAETKRERERERDR